MLRSAVAPRPSRTRYAVLAILFFTGVVNYLDRTNLSVAAPALTSELHIDAVTMGWIFSAFGWAYAALQIPAGWVADRIHPRILYPAAILLWSIATTSLGFVGGLFSLVVLRLMVGVFESPTYIMNNRILTTWFPEKERASTVAVYTSAQYVGLGFLAPVLLWVEASYGWRTIFLITGILGLLMALIWIKLYRDPSEFRGTNAAEVAHIKEGGGLPDLSHRMATQQSGRPKFSWRDLGIVLSRRKLWGIYIGQFCFLASGNFFTTWFPTYLIRYRHMGFISAGFYASVPFLGSFVGVLLSGFVSDVLLRRGMSLALARKIPVLIGIALSTLMVAAQFVDAPPLIIACLGISYFGTGMASITWSFVSVLAPERLIGLTGGVFNLFGGLSAIIIPVAIGYLVQGGDFTPAFILCATLAIVAGLSYVFLVGRMERVHE
jgi:ACS family D-galactonate transporter-like MFS transporter